MARRGKVYGEHSPQLPLGADGFVGETFIPGHCLLPQSGWEQPVFDGASDATIIEQSIDVFDVLVRISSTIICAQGGGFSNPLGS